MSGLVSVDAGYTVSVRRTRLSVFVLLTVALLAGESPTYIRHEKGIHISLHAQSKYRTQLAKLRFDKKKTPPRPLNKPVLPSPVIRLTGYTL